MTVTILHLPDYLPTSLNRILGHWSRRHRLKKSDRELVTFYALHQQLPEAEGKRRVDLRLVLPLRGRAIDRDNAFKVLLDSLVHAQLLVDDSPKWCVPGEVVYLRSGTSLRETFVLLTEL